VKNYYRKLLPKEAFIPMHSPLNKMASLGILSTAAMLFLPVSAAQAAVFSVTIDGSDAIFLAGRTDVTIPLASDPWTGPSGSFLTRHGGPTPEEIRETLPPFVSVAAGDVIRLADPAVGGVSFFNGVGAPFFGPSGNGVDGSNLNSLGGISGYKGPQGPLVGVFLDDSIPNSALPPATLDFTATGLGTNFTTLSPQLRQIFYIGDGVTTTGDFQTFIAPSSATRLFLGIPDGFSFVGAPGAYDDNDGRYGVRIGVNQVPTDPESVPEPATTAGLLVSSLLGALGWKSRAARTKTA
jgi:hypothetical protein